MLDGYLTAAQAIKKPEYKISLAYLTRLVRTGVIEGERVGNQWIVKESSLRAWLIQRGKLQPEAESGEQAGASAHA